MFLGIILNIFLILMNGLNFIGTQSNDEHADVDINLINRQHFIEVNGGDSLFYVHGDENKKLNMHVISIFLSKQSGFTKIVKSFTYGDASLVHYKMIDLDNDGVREVICIKEDESNYSVVIYHAVFAKSNYNIQQSYRKGPLGIPLGKTPPTEFYVLQVKESKHHKKILRLFYGVNGPANKEIIKHFDVFYDNKSKQYEER